jgi:hypothetical protein
MYSYDPRQEAPLPNSNNLPFIPPPDYTKTVKQHSSSNQRPSLLRLSPNNTTTGAGAGSNLTIFTDFNHHDHIVDLTNGKMIPAEDLSKPKKPAHQKLSPEEKREQTKNRVLKMLQTQGVPVFPGLNQPKLKPRPALLSHQQQSLNASTPTSASNNNFHQAQPATAIDSNPNFGVTKAYIKHLENHRKFDTLHSFQSCENCPICKQMINEIDEVLAKQKQRTNGSGRQFNHQSLITSGKAFEPLSVLEEDEPDEFADEEVVTNGVIPEGYTFVGNGNYPSTSKNGSLDSRSRYHNGHNRESSVGSEPNEDVMTARARDDWVPTQPNQLAIKYGETLRVIKMGQDFICCQNAHNEKGWVPSNQLYLMPSGAY